MSDKIINSSFVCWQPKYSVGIDIVDDQHKKIFAMINELDNGGCAHNGKATIGKALEDMASYVEYHFETEKSHLKDLPGFAEHEKQHWDFTKKTLQFTKEYHRKPEDKMLHDIVSFLVNWLKEHIKGTDIEQFKLYRNCSDQ